MPKLGFWPKTKKPHHRIKSEGSQGQKNLGRFEKANFPRKKPGAPIPFAWPRPVVRRSTFHRGGYPDILKPQTVLPSHTLGLTRPTGAPQGPVEPAARLIPREHAPRPVCPVRPGRQADHNDPRPRVPPTRYWLSPVGFVPVSGLFLPGHLFPPPDQPGATPTGGDFPPEGFQAHPWARGGIRQEVRPIQREIWCRFFATIAYPTAANGATNGNRMRCPSHRQPGTKVRQYPVAPALVRSFPSGPRA